MQERYSNGFLLDFVNLDEERMSLYKQKKLPKLVYLKELVSHGRLWLTSEKGRQVYKHTIGDQYVYDESFEVLESQKKSYDECDVNDSITDVQILQGIFYMETYLELKSLVRTTIALTRLALLNIIMIIAFLISTATYNLTISTITVLLRSPPTPSKIPVLVRCFRVVFQYLVLLVQNLIMRILDRKTNPFLSVKVRKILFSQRMAFLHFLFLRNFATNFIILILSLIFPQNVLVYVTCIGVFYRLLETIVNELISEGKFKQLLIYYEDLKLLFPSLFRLLVVYLHFCGIFTVFILLSGNPEAGMDSTIAV